MSLLDKIPHVFEPGGGSRTLVIFHGTGGDETSLLRFAPLIDPEAGVLSMRGQSMDEGYPRFFRRLSEGVFDLDDLQEKAKELATFLSEAYDRYGVEASRTVAFGYSNGANIAGGLLLLFPGTLAAAVLARPMMPIDPPIPPDLAQTSALLLIGANDRMCPPGEGERMAAALRGYGARCEVELLAAGHELTQEDFVLASKWAAAI